MLSCIALVVSLTAPSQAAPNRIRGLDPALAPKYSSKNVKFACLDGREVIPFDRVNDDFCDCTDGSDEPGNLYLRLSRFFHQTYISRTSV